MKTYVDPPWRKIRAVPVRTPAAPTASASQVSVGSHCAANAPRSRCRSQSRRMLLKPGPGPTASASQARSRSQHSSSQAHIAEKHGSHSSDGVHFTGKAAPILKLSAKKKKRAKRKQLPTILNPAPMHTVLLMRPGPGPGLSTGLSTPAAKHTLWKSMTLIPVTVFT